MASTGKRILIVTPFFTMGGAETQAFLLAQHLHATGRYVEVWAFPREVGENPLEQKLNTIGITTQTFPFRMDVFSTRFKKYKALLNYLSMVRKKRFDFIIPFTFWPNLLCNSMAMFSRVKKVFWNQRNIEDHVPVTMLEKFVRLKEPIWVSNSNPGIAFLHRRFAVNKNMVHLISNAYIPLTTKLTPDEWYKKLGIKPGTPVITMVANFFVEKDHITVLRAIAVLRNSFPSVMLLLPGYSPNLALTNLAKAEALDLQLQDNVKFLGSVSDIGGLLNISFIGLLSTKSEGCPNSIIEYMGAAIPVVATNIPAITDIVGTDYAYLFEVGDVNGLALKLSQLLLNSELRQEVGEKLQSNALEKFIPEKMYKAYLDLMES